MKWFFAYLALINLIAAVVCAADKKCAKKKKRRVPEAVLFELSLLGGSVGMLVTMLAVRHKTKHLKFMLGIPAILLLQIAVLCALYFLIFA